MPALQRSVSIRGPRFYLDGERLMFVRHLDSSTREGPREATAADRRDHPEALKRFKAGTDHGGFEPLLTFKTPAGA